MSFIQSLIDLDTDITIFLNGFNNSFFDILMFWISDKFIWIPFYLFLLFLVWRKKNKGIFVVLFFIALLVFVADQSSVHLFKNIFERLRPCHNENLKDIIHIVNNHCGGSFGFVSSHATNTFSLAVFISFILSNKKMTFLLLIWAAVVSYSRVYLGVHFFGDVIGGAILGTIVAIIIFYLYKVSAIKINRLF